MLLLRVDDFPGTKPEEFWRHNLDEFRRFDDVVARHGHRYVLGVIPKHTTEADLDFFERSPHIDVALHGRNHDERFPNEFLPHETYNEVCEALASCKTRLDRCNAGGVDVYVPPHNVIDRRTVLALKQAGFKHVFGGPGTDEGVFDECLVGLTMFDAPFFYGRSDELLSCGAVEHITGASDPRLCLHWTWERNIGLEHLERFLKELDG